MPTFMKIPNFVDVGLIIGTRGAMIQRIQAETGTSISHRRDSDVFKILGSDEDMEKAVNRILDLINKQAVRAGKALLRRDQLIVPESHDSSSLSSQQQVQQKPRTSATMRAEDALDAMNAAANMDFNVLTDDEKRQAYAAAEVIYGAFENPRSDA